MLKHIVPACLCFLLRMLQFIEITRKGLASKVVFHHRNPNSCVQLSVGNAKVHPVNWRAALAMRSLGPKSAELKTIYCVMDLAFSSAEK